MSGLGPACLLTTGAGQYDSAVTRNKWLILSVTALVLAAVAVGLVARNSSSSSADHGKIMPAYVAKLYRDGYTKIKQGVSQNNVYGCPDFAIGDGGVGYGELVVQCPNGDDAYMAALNLGGEVDGNLVIKTGPLSSL